MSANSSLILGRGRFNFFFYSVARMHLRELFISEEQFNQANSSTCTTSLPQGQGPDSQGLSSYFLKNSLLLK